MRFPNPSTFLRIALAIALLAAPALAQSASADAGVTADEVMTRVESKAAAEHKNILLMFGASWCGNCHLFDKFLADPKMHPIMDKLFVFVDLATGEQSGDKRHANIPGGQKLQASLGGRDAGYPYIVMLDSGGNLLADSVAPRGNHGSGGNIGYPDSPSEIAWFMEMLKKGAPTLSTEERASIRDWLKSHSTTH
jgi:hypothetical protein